MTNTIIGRCAYCGCSDPREPFHYHHDDDKQISVRLWCSDEFACEARQNAEAAAAWLRRKLEVR